MSLGARKHLPVSVRQRLRNLRDKTGDAILMNHPRFVILIGLLLVDKENYV